MRCTRSGDRDRTGLKGTVFRVDPARDITGDCLLDQEQSQRGTLRLALGVHLVLALVIFSPFFLSGRVLIASTDNYFYIFPNMIFGNRYLAEAQFFPWNSYLLNGFDFSSSNYNFMFSPYNWVICLFPEKYFFEAFTALSFVSVWLVGVLSYLFFKEELGTARWALLASITYQLCGQLFFSLNMYPYFPGLLFSTAAVYVIWTMHRRDAWKSYLALTAMLSLILLTCHVVRAFAMILMVCILFAYRFWPDCLNVLRFRQRSTLFYLSLITAVLIAMIRLFPLVVDLQGSDRLTTVPFHKSAVQGRDVYYGLHAFVPELFGVRYGQRSPLSDGKLSYYAYDLTYFGVIPAFLCLYAIIRRGLRPVFWIVFALAAIAYNLGIAPVADLPKLLTYPALHAFLLKIFPPLAICVLVGYGGKFLEEDIRNGNHLRWMTVAVGAILVGLVLVLVMKDSGLHWHAKVWSLGIIVLLSAWTIWSRRESRRRLVAYLFCLVPLVTLLGVLLIWLPWSPMLKAQPEPFLRAVAYMTITLAATSAAWMIVMLVSRKRVSEKTGMVLAGVLAAAALLAMIWPVSSPSPGATTDFERFALAMFSAWRLILMVSFLAYLVLVVKLAWLKARYIFPVLCLVVFFDLAPYDKVYGDLITPAFWDAGRVQYPRSLQPIFEDIISNRGQEARGPSLVANGKFESWNDRGLPDGWLVNLPAASAVRSTGENKVCGSAGITVKVRDPKGCLYQDFPSPDVMRGTLVSAGVWVKASQPNFVRLLFTDRLCGVYSQYHSGSGQWEWLKTQFRIAEYQNPRIRLHVMASYKGVFHADGAVSARGADVGPFYNYAKEDIPAAFAVAVPPKSDESRPEPLDLKRYRLPQPCAFFGLGGKYTYTHIPYLYGVRSFGGVNGFRSRQFLELIAHFSTDSDPAPGGGAHFEYLNSQRFLDIMGCGYDLDAEGKIVRRPGALSRFMQFSGVAVVEAEQQCLAMLKDPDFDPKRTVILSPAPQVLSQDAGGPARDLDFEQLSTNRIELTVQSDRGGIVLFNDSYDDGWRAFLNGTEQPVYRANHNFMATAVPAGESLLTFEFRPSDYGVRSWSTGVGMLMLVGITGGLFAVGRRRRCVDPGDRPPQGAPEV